MRTLLTLSLLVTASLSAMANADPFAHVWCRLATPHFEIVTDLKPRDIGKLALQMEVFRVTAGAFIHGGGKSADLPLKVIVFRDRGDFRSTMKAPHFSGFMQPSLRESMLIIGPQPGNRLLHETALHEYTHYLLRNLIDVNFPAWYDEGMATFLSTMRMDDRHVRIGSAPAKELRKALRSSSVSIEETVQGQRVYDWKPKELDDFYRTAWALVHFIEFGHVVGFADRRPQLDAYLRATTTPFEAAFETSYDKFANELQRYLRKNKLPSVEQPRPDVSLPSMDPQCLDDEDRDYELARAMMGRNPHAALATLQVLHAASPTDVRFLVGLSTVHYELHQYTAAMDFAEQALTLAPDDVSAQIEFASRLVHGCVLIRASGCTQKWIRAVKLFRSGIRQDPERFDAVLGLGLSYLHSGRPGDALNYLRIAYQKAPWAPQINFYLGESYRMIGDRRAVTHLTNARNWSTQEIWQRLAETALAELD